MKVINLNKSEDLLGKKLTRGCQIFKPFYSQAIGCKVGNIRTALTYLSRENVDKDLVAKPKLNKEELNKIVILPKKKISNYDNTLKALLSERIIHDLEVALELSKHYYKEGNYFALEFISEDANGRKFEDMNRYCKILNRLMLDSVFVSVVLNITNKQNDSFKRKINIKDIKQNVGRKQIKAFDKARPFIKTEKEEIRLSDKKRVVKNFKKQLPYTKIK